MIFAVLLPFGALVVVGGILAFIFIKHEIGKVTGLYKTTSSKNTLKASDEKPSPQEFKIRYKPYKRNTQDEDLPADVDEGNKAIAHPWRW